MAVDDRLGGGDRERRSIRLSVKMTAEASRVTQPASRVMAPARYTTPSANSTYGNGPKPWSQAVARMAA